VGEPYAHATTGIYPYASPQEGGQYLASISSTVSYVTAVQAEHVNKEKDESQPPYCVAYHYNQNREVE
jgi:hypothetical protein